MPTVHPIDEPKQNNDSPRLDKTASNNKGRPARKTSTLCFEFKEIIMNRTQLIAAAVLSLAGSAAFAQSEIDLQYFGQNQTSSVTRSQVRAEVAKARATGELTTPNEVVAAAVAPQAPVGLTRAQVRAEVLAARATLAVPTEVAMFNQAPVSTRSREAVRAEAIEFAKNASLYRVEAGY